jgi:hypothetical protein
MPDQFGFDHLGAAVRCIDCPTGGPIWRWPKPKRSQHARTHRLPRGNTANLSRQRELLAAPPTNPNEENKEAITMANTKTTKGESTKAVTVDMLLRAGAPLTAKEIAKRVIDSGRCTSLEGKTPEATISAMLAVGAKPGGLFKRVAKGTYILADDDQQATETVEAKQPGAKRRTAKGDAQSQSAQTNTTGATAAAEPSA